MKITRSASLLVDFDRPEWTGRRWVIPPLTRGQAREIFALDPDDAAGLESPAALELRIAEQVRIGTRAAYEIDAADRRIVGAGLPIDELTYEEERKLLVALVSHHRGQDPASALALSALLKKNALAGVLAGASDDSTPSTATA